MDQNLLVYDVNYRETTKDKKSNLVLTKVSSRCLFLDEVIDIKFFKPDNEFALMCSNSETLKLMDLNTGIVELYKGHNEIILCLDIC
jgi:hypothetical protein